MSKPTGFLVKMLLFVLAVIGVAFMLREDLIEAFEANPAINGLILGVLFLGIINNFRQVGMLFPEIHWIESYRSDQTLRSDFKPPKLLSPMASMIGEKRDRLTLSTVAMRSVLDGIGSRLDESRDVSRYTIGLLIFLGLLGTFWGLLDTVQSIGNVIGGLTIGSGADTAEIFQNLKSGLQQPLGGMGTAFSSSLFGLAGSLALGFLDLQSGQAQNRFYNELEDWLSSITNLTGGGIIAGGEGDGSVPFYVQALLEQTAENLQNLERILSRGEESRINANNNIVGLTEQLGQLGDQMAAQQELMSKLAAGQADIRPVLTKLAEGGGGGGGMDETTRAHIRNLDVHMGRLFEELSVGREDSVRQIRSEIKVLTRTLAALAEPVDGE